MRRIPLFILFFTVNIIHTGKFTLFEIWIGKYFSNHFGASNGMAGMSAAYFMPSNINYQNLASYADINYAMFDAGAYGIAITLDDDGEKFTSGDGNLSALAFDFPS
ncbi:MAG: hypothetical protein IPL12_21350 [Bacteroidetes bacterium]|nr:hypothetical protein [Bacteroidota bacterium]